MRRSCAARRAFRLSELIASRRGWAQDKRRTFRIPVSVGSLQAMASVAACSIPTASASAFPWGTPLKSASEFADTQAGCSNPDTVKYKRIFSRRLTTGHVTRRSACRDLLVTRRERSQSVPSFSQRLLSPNTLTLPSLSLSLSLGVEPKAQAQASQRPPTASEGRLTLTTKRPSNSLSFPPSLFLKGTQPLCALRRCSVRMDGGDHNASSVRRREGTASTRAAAAAAADFGGKSSDTSALGGASGIADVSAVEEPTASPSKQKGGAASPLKLAGIVGLWYLFNVVFNIYNKKVLNAFPFPWLTSTLSLLAGTVFMLGMWATKAQPVPRVSKEFMMALAPVALFHTVGHVAATVSMSKVAVSFTHIIKSAEPVFSVMVSSLFLGEHFSVPVYLSLLPIVLGCSIAAVTELTFNAAGFWGAMISNVAFVLRNVFSKKGLEKFKEIDGINLYAMISIVSLLYLAPFAFYVEGTAAWKAGWQMAISHIGPQVGWWIFLQSLFYHLYNQLSYMALDNISPLTFSVGNTMKRVVVIVTSIIAFNTKVSPLNAVGSAIAILGTFLYSQGKAGFVLLRFSFLKFLSDGFD
ncbi:hypothetical protein CBR_g11106 [Chara braunii]|uniref:Sugar phosphate transporter domain-containing protein n=1 Tax=Chara braunii TaxID=69332 RepID=A0A388KQG6_CHABU|nr:hypothetical protein CBR_g11106 [Chara braunii]|eukprot:GBG72173.1 hypothetical protein CBR_g11106 [Chara braunii]